MKFKKMLAVVSALCMMCAVVPFSEKYVPETAILASAEDEEYIYENFKYKKYSEHFIISDTGELLPTEPTYVSITGVIDKEITEANIPAEIDGLPVTSIGYFAFRDCSSLTSVTIPNSITTIDDYAFDGCPLTAITIPDSVTSIGNHAFDRCALTAVTIPDSVTSIGLQAFRCCSNLTFVTIPESVTNIEGGAFDETPWLKAKQEENPLVIVNHILIDGKTCSGDVIIPDSVTEIGGYAFQGCSALTSVIIPDSVTYIGPSAFGSCHNLTSVTIPDSVTYIGHEAFDYSSLTSVTIPDSVTYIGFGAFRWCSSLTSVTVSENITNIGSGTFENCSLLTSVNIPDSVTSIEYNAFAGCSSLTSVTIPDGITTIERRTFSGCSSLTSVTIPDNVSSIGGGAFAGCSGLTSVTIPDSVTSIEDFAFSECSNLTSVIIKNPDCEIYDSNFCITNRQDENNQFYFNGTIYGYENSTAQAYAEKYSYKFESLGTAPETEEIAPGDADNSGKVDILDVITVNKAILGKEKLTDEQLKAIDFNSDGKPDASDSLKLMKFIVGLITSLTE